jgi:trans-2,3-dihydro-3-hydroxyanthranilate isomerase
MAHALTWLDVFTDRPLTGNGLAVVHDADGVSDDTMLAFARETHLSETTFVQTATEAGADYRNRIWMMQGELPFAGHPSLGTAVAVARARGEQQASYVQQTHAGLQPIDVRLDGDGARASMLQEPPVFGAEVAADDVMATAGLAAVDGHPDLPPQVVSTGEAQLMAPVRDRAALERVAVEFRPLRALLEPIGALVLYLVAVDPDAGCAHARSFFAGVGGVVEDPGTGAAAGPLLAYLNDRVGTRTLTIRQGDEIGRPSRLDCSWAEDRPRVAGDVVVVADGHASL